MVGLVTRERESTKLLEVETMLKVILCGLEVGMPSNLDKHGHLCMAASQKEPR